MKKVNSTIAHLGTYDFDGYRFEIMYYAEYDQVRVSCRKEGCGIILDCIGLPCAINNYTVSDTLELAIADIRLNGVYYIESLQELIKED